MDIDIADILEWEISVNIEIDKGDIDPEPVHTMPLSDVKLYLEVCVTYNVIFIQILINLTQICSSYC